MGYSMKNIALILASGSGSRCGLNYPKQFIKVNNKTILEYTVDVFEKNKYIDEIIIVANKEYIEKIADITKKYLKVKNIVSGGDTRKDSSYNGVMSINYEDANVLIHDAARPLISESIVNECIFNLDKYNSVCVAIPSVDTLLQVDNNKDIISVPERRFVYRAQTPQCFKLSLIKQAHTLANSDTSCYVTDDCGLIIKYTNEKIHIVDGSEDNIKITYLEDINFLESKLLKISS